MFTPPAAATAAVCAALWAAGAAHAQGATYAIDPTHTFVTFEVTHFGTSTNRGRFDKKSGSITFDRAGKSGKVDISIETGSINTGTVPFDKHLQSKDFFDSESHPSARFVGERFSFEGDKVSEVAGTLTLLGRTNPVVPSDDLVSTRMGDVSALAFVHVVPPSVVYWYAVIRAPPFERGKK
ncbi:MAG: YceI family protein [Betaproteobacteria bacterium]|nr:YceI family protein [Betaproteobacteria bacterium]